MSKSEKRLMEDCHYLIDIHVLYMYILYIKYIGDKYEQKDDNRNI